MYRSVTIIERRMQRYGVNSLRVRVALASADNTSQQEESRGFTSRLKGMLKFSSKSSNTRSNTMRSQKRAVLHMAIAYAGSWLLVFGLFHYGGPLHFLLNFLFPLQGFFSFLVFMAPKVRDTRKISRMRRREKDLTWCQAFRKAYMARGPARLNSRALTRR